MTLLGSALGLAAPLLLLAQLLTSCGSDDGGNACVPNATSPCTCGAAVQGTQTCKEDGSGFDLCSCETGAGSGGSGGGSSSGGTGGGAQAPGGAGSTGMAPDALFPNTIGASCSADADCAGAPEICLKATTNTDFDTTDNPAGGGPQGGYCSVRCASDADCQAVDDIAACNTALGICFSLCIPGTSAVKCGADRAQACVPANTAGTIGACIPRCTSDAACGAGRFCDPSSLGLCVDAQPQGGKVGDPCSPDTETTDCASGVCLQFRDPNDPNGFSGSFCTANCTYGLDDGCGYDAVSGGVRQAFCRQPQIRTGDGGDIGFCTPLCDTDNDCVQASSGWVCSLFNDVNAEQLVGRKGECLPAVLAGNGSTDAGAVDAGN